MSIRHSAAATVAAILLIGSAACSGEGNNDTSQAAASNARSSATTVELNDANLEALERGLRKEIEIIRRPGRGGSHYRVSLQAIDEEAQEVAEAAGMSVVEYRDLHDAVEGVLTPLNFQGKIGPPRSIDLDQVSDEFRAKIEGDPYAALSPGSAAALRSWEERIAKVWSEIMGQTALHG